jgi:hypothetical protein
MVTFLVGLEFDLRASTPPVQFLSFFFDDKGVNDMFISE